LSKGKDVILDRAFYAKEDRDMYAALIEQHGGRKVLVYLSAPKSVLWERIQARRAASLTADSMFEISTSMLDMYYDNFEIPNGEGEVVVDTMKL
jgi:predicted kinase